MKKKVLVFGATGMLGRDVVRTFAEQGLSADYEIFPLGSADCDITNSNAVTDKITGVCPDFVVNCAAYTAVDKAESEPEQARLLNATAVENIARAVKQIGALLIHISTDYVFDGNAHRPWKETDLPNPISVYGQTKLRGEEAIQSIGCKSVILRVQWLYSYVGKNFLLTMLRLFQTKAEVGVVDDQLGTPTWTANLARAIWHIILCEQENIEGIYNYSDDGTASWYDFAAYIAKLAHTTCKLHPIKTYDYPTPASRPAYSVLDKDKILKTFNGLRLMRWQMSLELCYARLQTEILS